MAGRCFWCDKVLNGHGLRRYCDKECQENATRRRHFFICGCGRVRLAPFSTRNQNKCDHCRLNGELVRRANDLERNRARDRERYKDPAYQERRRLWERRRAASKAALKPPPEPESPCKHWPRLKLSSCRWCDMPYWHSDTGRFCSEQCRKESIDSSTRHSHGSPVFPAQRSHICPDCRAHVPSVNQKCDLCKQNTKAQARKRRKLEKRKVPSEPYTLREIAERDGYLCGICGKLVDMGLEGHFSDDRAPTRDHIIPISLGGPDFKSNVQLAHRKCNWLKGNKMPDLQLF